MNYTHRIYGCERSKGFETKAPRMKPLDLRNGNFVTNVIYATMLPEHEVEKVVKELNEQNPEFKFEARKI